jgi:uncharacterized protein with PIN domain
VTDFPAVSAFSETAALFALMRGDRDETRRICAAMTPPERTDFSLRLLELREILDDVGATRCKHCGQRIAKVPASAIKGGSPNTIYWFHSHNSKSHCDAGGTMAEPTPEEPAR